MNVLVIGDCSEELCNFIKKSKFCHKIYTMFSSPLENFANIEYANINDLCEKAKILKIDIALIMDGNFIQNGIGEFLKKQKINVIASSQKWFNLELSNFIAKQLVYHYSMNIPQIIKTPLSFPVVLKANENNYTKIINSMDELITEKVNLKDNTFFFEELIQGDIYKILFLWDKKTLLGFPPQTFTEVQLDRFNLFKTKLNFMMSDEKADFIGFFSIKLIWSKNEWYLLDFNMKTSEDLIIQLKDDILGLINSAIYQNLHELDTFIK